MTISITVELTGRQPLLCHNVEAANPASDLGRAMSAISSKRKKTDTDREELAKLEWFAGLYLARGITGPALPTANIRACFIEAGKINRLGTDVTRALNFSDLFVPLAYKGPRDVDELYDQGDFIHTAMVRVSAARVARTRPMFTEWSVVADGYLEDDILSYDKLLMVAEGAGRVIGLGDNRKNGYGRFTADIKKQK